VEQLVQLDFYPRSATSSVPALEVRGENYPLVHLASYLHLTPGPVSDKSPVLLINAGQRRWGVLVDAIAGRQEIVAKSLGSHLRNVPGVSGATVLGNGQVVLILDAIETLARPLRPNANVPQIPPPGTVLPGAQPNNRSSVLGEQRVSLRPSAANSPARPGQAPGSDGRTLPYILVVDDSPSVRRVVSQTLKNAGWDVLTARDGAEALEVVAQRIPVGILLDIEMPRMDGYELMAKLRSQPMYQKIPLVVLTSRAATKHQQRALQLGADAYVVKPYQDDQLLTTINALVPVRPNGDPR
ncbi:MAG: response regulator, partial [Ktedonobacterales bacterium]|nr:response regulator [Ktedonobacterales bacterium]